MCEWGLFPLPAPPPPLSSYLPTLEAIRAVMFVQTRPLLLLCDTHKLCRVNGGALCADNGTLPRRGEVYLVGAVKQPPCACQPSSYCAKPGIQWPQHHQGVIFGSVWWAWGLDSRTLRISFRLLHLTLMSPSPCILSNSFLRDKV